MPHAGQTQATTLDFDADAPPLLFRGLMFAAMGSVVPWALLAYYVL